MKEGSLCQLCHCHIKDNTIFSDLTDNQLEPFKNIAITSFHKRKDIVFMEGDSCHGFYIIKSGRIKLIRTSKQGKEQIIKISQPGELLGMEIFYEGKNHTNTAIVMDDTELCFIERKNFFMIIEHDPLLARRLIITLSKELNRAYDKIGYMGLLNAKAKLANLLNTLAHEYGKKDNGVVRLTLSLSRLEIAELLGITQETSIRLLKNFKDEGLIDIKRKEIIIKSLDGLKEAAGA